MSDPAPRPLTGLELARAALLGLSAGLAGTPLLAAIDLPAQPEGLAPLAPAWIARGGSLALGVGLACLAVPRLIGRGPLDRNQVRAEVAVRLAILASLVGTIATVIAFAALLRPPARHISLSPVLGVMVSPVGAALAAGVACGALGGRHGRWPAARKGATVGFAAWILVGRVPDPPAYSAGACARTVRSQKRAILARISSAGLVHTNGFGVSLLTSRYR